MNRIIISSDLESKLQIAEKLKLIIDRLIQIGSNQFRTNPEYFNFSVHSCELILPEHTFSI